MVNDMVLPSGVLEPAALSPQEIWAVDVHRRSGFPQDVTVALLARRVPSCTCGPLPVTSFPTAWARLCT